MLKKYEISDNNIVESSKENSPVSLYINPDETEKKYLTEALKIDEHTLHSSLDPDELSRLEFEPDHIALIIKRPKNYSGKDNLLFKTTSQGMFLFKDKIIIIIYEDINIFEGKFLKEIKSIKDLFLKLISGVVHHFEEHLKVFNKISEELEKRINTSMGNKYLIKLFTLEKSLVYYLNSINSNTIALEKIKNNIQKIGLNEEESESLDDIIIENTQCYRQSEIYSNILANLLNARVSIVNNNINILMKTLNVIMVLIMVPTFIISAFSMNVKIPFADHPYAFYIIMGFALISVIFVVLIWKKMKW